MIYSRVPGRWNHRGSIDLSTVTPARPLEGLLPCRRWHLSKLTSLYMSSGVVWKRVWLSMADGMSLGWWS